MNIGQDSKLMLSDEEMEELQPVGILVLNNMTKEKFEAVLLKARESTQSGRISQHHPWITRL